MSSRKNSCKTHSELSSNSITANNDNASEDISNKSINLNEFLDFLNLSCHVNDMISSQSNDDYQGQHKENIQTGKSSGVAMPSGCENHSKTHGMHSPINLQNLSQNRLVNDLYGFNLNEDINYNSATNVGNTPCPLQRNSITMAKTKLSNCNEGGLHEKLNEKLDYVLNEGILDAVLPFVCPVPLPPNFTNRLKPKQREIKDQKVSTSTPLTTLACEGSNEVETGTTSKDCSSKVKGKSSATHSNTTTLNSATTKDPEVVIHVCDEVKNTSKDFMCPQSLLVSKMGYFADVTAGQKLEDMDISVHCDIQIFEWLMKWVKSENGYINSSTSVDPGIDSGPNLNVNNVVPILVSACFLQMEPLLLDCLTFCHSRLGDVVRVSTNLSCLNDTIITRMAAMFTNVELETVCDKKNRLLPRLWTKLICSIFEPETEALRGHYYSLAGLFMCSKYS